MSHCASADQVHLNLATIYGSPQSHFPPCQAAGDVADLDVDVVVAGLDTVQNFAPTPAFLQLSARPVTIIEAYMKLSYNLISESILAYGRILILN